MSRPVGAESGAGEGRRGLWLVGPGIGWLVAFFLVPTALIIGMSFLERSLYGGVTGRLTLEHYLRLIDPLYLRIVWRTVAWAAICTACCLVLGYPVAFTIARAGPRKNLLLFLVMLPFWTSLLVRTFAMIFLLRDTGLINSFLLAIGVIDRPIELLYTPGAVIFGLISGFLPLMILPIYASLERLDQSLLEAAEVLGARPFARFTRVILPLSLPGVFAGILLTFIPALGSFLAPDLLGGAKQIMLGNLVQNQFTTSRNWPFGAAASVLLVASVMVLPIAYATWRSIRRVTVD